MSVRCELCGRPIASDETDVDDVHCFVRFDPDSRQSTDFEVTCLRLAVARLQRQQDAKALRAQFAGQALQGLLASDAAPQSISRQYTWEERPELAAKSAVSLADALLAELGHEVSR